MLRHTFIHLPGIGAVTEGEIWRQGVTTWEEFLDASSLPARAENRRSELNSLIMKSQSQLKKGNASFFHSMLPGGERWRLYPEFRHHAAFLDIETTGLSPAYSYITMVGILDANGYTAYVKGENLDDLREALEQYDLVVTYNGAAFDIPYVEHQFGQVFRHTAHIDLRMPLRRLGYRGGLKSIERQLNLGRPSELSGLNGFDAVILWHMWENGDKGARDTLIRYNAEDVGSLPALADIVYNRLALRLPVPCSSPGPFPRQPIDHLHYDVDAILRLKSLLPQFARY